MTFPAEFIIRSTWYDLELVLYPTDVTNHYSGFPITRFVEACICIFKEEFTLFFSENFYRKFQPKIAD